MSQLRRKWPDYGIKHNAKKQVRPTTFICLHAADTQERDFRVEMCRSRQSKAKRSAPFKTWMISGSGLEVRKSERKFNPFFFYFSFPFNPPRLCFSQAKEAELLQINKILEDSDLSAAKYHQWREHNEELVQEIEKAAKAKASEAKDGSPARDTPPPSPTPPPLPSSPPPQEVATEAAAPPPPEKEGAYRLSLSEGEQLVDAEPCGNLLDTPKASSSPDGSPVLELSIGSLQDSINKELSELGTENYFYI